MNRDFELELNDDASTSTENQTVKQEKTGRNRMRSVRKTRRAIKQELLSDNCKEEQIEDITKHHASHKQTLVKEEDNGDCEPITVLDREELVCEIDPFCIENANHNNGAGKKVTCESITEPAKSVEKVSKNTSKIEQYQCEFCNKWFRLKDSYVKHVRNHVIDKKFVCEICDGQKSFRRRTDYDIHMAQHASETPEAVNFRFKCEFCQKSFADERTLKLHSNKKHAYKKFQCSICQKSYTQKGSLNIHMKVHTMGKKFQCSLCEKAYNNMSNLHRHMNIHTLKNQYTCTVCSKAFNYKISLNIHMKTHTLEKNFTCFICGNSYAQRSSFNSHINSHNQTKSYRCETCEKTFNNKSNLKRHIAMHAEHEEKYSSLLSE